MVRLGAVKMQRNANPSNALPRFFTESGAEIPSVTAEQMREIDRIAIEETGPNLFQMMENAGRSLALLALNLLGGAWPKARVTVLAGGGGNGGGGICAARHLANRGIAVSLCLATEWLGEVPAQQRRIFRSTRGKEIDPDDLSRTPAVSRSDRHPFSHRSRHSGGDLSPGGGGCRFPVRKSVLRPPRRSVRVLQSDS